MFPIAESHIISIEPFFLCSSRLAAEHKRTAHRLSIPFEFNEVIAIRECIVGIRRYGSSSSQHQEIAAFFGRLGCHRRTMLMPGNEDACTIANEQQSVFRNPGTNAMDGGKGLQVPLRPLL